MHVKNDRIKNLSTGKSLLNRNIRTDDEYANAHEYIIQLAKFAANYDYPLIVPQKGC